MICHVCNAKWPLLMDRRHIRCTCLALHHNYHGICTQWHLYKKITIEHNYISYTITFTYICIFAIYIFNRTNTRNLFVSHFMSKHLHSTLPDTWPSYVWPIFLKNTLKLENCVTLSRLLDKALIFLYISSKQRHISCHNTHGYNFPHNSQQFLLHISCDMRPSSRSASFFFTICCTLSCSDMLNLWHFAILHSCHLNALFQEKQVLHWSLSHTSKQLAGKLRKSGRQSAVIVKMWWVLWQNSIFANKIWYFYVYFMIEHNWEHIGKAVQIQNVPHS